MYACKFSICPNCQRTYIMQRNKNIYLEKYDTETNSIIMKHEHVFSTTMLSGSGMRSAIKKRDKYKHTSI